MYLSPDDSCRSVGFGIADCGLKIDSLLMDAVDALGPLLIVHGACCQIIASLMTVDSWSHLRQVPNLRQYRLVSADMRLYLCIGFCEGFLGEKGILRALPPA